jgi:hypothetical protein
MVRCPICEGEDVEKYKCCEKYRCRNCGARLDEELLEMVMINVVRLSTTTHSGGDSNTYDNDFDTYYSLAVSGDNAGATTYDTHTFAASATIRQIRFRLYVTATTTSGASSNTASATAKIEIYVGSTWTQVGSTYSVSVSGDQTDSEDSGVISVAGSWNATAIRAVISVSADKECSPDCGGSQSAEARIYEVQAYAGGSSSGVI